MKSTTSQSEVSLEEVSVSLERVFKQVDLLTELDVPYIKDTLISLLRILAVHEAQLRELESASEVD